MAVASTTLNSSLILQLSSCFGKIEELTLNFYAPTMTNKSTRTTYATTINKFIKRFDTPELLLLRNIRKIVIIGQSCMESGYEYERSVQDDRVEHLQALQEPAQRIKDAFLSEG
jgi:predicted Mrr-cat superfamily restriction endonuclease